MSHIAWADVRGKSRHVLSGKSSEGSAAIGFRGRRTSRRGLRERPRRRPPAAAPATPSPLDPGGAQAGGAKTGGGAGTAGERGCMSRRKHTRRLIERSHTLNNQAHTRHRTVRDASVNPKHPSACSQSAVTQVRQRSRNSTSATHETSPTVHLIRHRRTPCKGQTDRTNTTEHIDTEVGETRHYSKSTAIGGAHEPQESEQASKRVSGQASKGTSE